MPVWLVFDGLERFPCEVPLGCLFIPNKNLEPPGWCQEDDVPDLEVANFWVPMKFRVPICSGTPQDGHGEREGEREREQKKHVQVHPAYVLFMPTTSPLQPAVSIVTSEVAL